MADSYVVGDTVLSPVHGPCTVVGVNDGDGTVCISNDPTRKNRHWVDPSEVSRVTASTRVYAIGDVVVDRDFGICSVKSVVGRTICIQSHGAADLRYWVDLDVDWRKVRLVNPSSNSVDFEGVWYRRRPDGKFQKTDMIRGPYVWHEGMKQGRADINADGDLEIPLEQTVEAWRLRAAKKAAMGRMMSAVSGSSGNKDDVEK